MNKFFQKENTKMIKLWEDRKVDLLKIDPLIEFFTNSDYDEPMYKLADSSLRVIFPRHTKKS